MTPEQLRAARALCDLSRRDLARIAGTSSSSVVRFETSTAQTNPSTVEKWRKALTARGVVFLAAGEVSKKPPLGPGVRLQVDLKTEPEQPASTAPQRAAPKGKSPPRASASPRTKSGKST